MQKLFDEVKEKLVSGNVELTKDEYNFINEYNNTYSYTMLNQEDNVFKFIRGLIVDNIQEDEDIENHIETLNTTKKLFNLYCEILESKKGIKIL